MIFKKNIFYPIAILFISIIAFSCTHKAPKPMLPSEIYAIDASGTEKLVYKFLFDEQNRLVSFDQHFDDIHGEERLSTEIYYNTESKVDSFVVKYDTSKIVYNTSWYNNSMTISSTEGSVLLNINDKGQLVNRKTVSDDEEFVYKTEYEYRTKGRLTQQIDYVLDAKLKNEDAAEKHRTTTYYRYDQRTTDMLQYSATPQWIIEYFRLSFWAYNPVRVNYKGILRSTLNKQENAEDISYENNKDAYPETITIKHEGQTTIYKVKYTEAK